VWATAGRGCDRSDSDRQRWHVCELGYHRAMWPGLHLLVRPVEEAFHARLQDEAGEAVTLDGANCESWEYGRLEDAQRRGEEHALKVALEKGLLRR
jgi:hypothetical protein